MTTTKIFELESDTLVATLPEGVVEMGAHDVKTRDTVERRALAANVIIFERSWPNPVRKFGCGPKTRVKADAVHAIQAAEAIPYGKYKMVVGGTGETIKFRFATGSPVQASPVHEDAHPAPGRDYHSFSMEIMEL